MKYLFILLVIFTSACAKARVITLPRNGTNAIYINDASQIIKAGDTVQLEGDYKSILVKEIHGTKEQPVHFINKGLVTVSGYSNYTCVFTGSYYIIDGSGDPNYKYGIKLGKENELGAFGIGPGNSTGVEIHNVEFTDLSSGILQNPHSGEPMVDCYYHDNYFHDFDNPKAKGRSEPFYLGFTGGIGAQFENCRIENNIIENVSGDGIQVCNGSFKIIGNTVKKYAKASLVQQRTGILIGGNCTAVVKNNTIEDGRGVGMQVFGMGKIEIANNTFKNIVVNDLDKEDIVYINGKTATPDNPLQLNFHDNKFENCTPNRKLIFNGTSPDKTAGSSFKRNKGLDQNMVSLTQKDKWEK